MITGVVLARNEERNIVECLRNLRPHVEELFLIDMESSDQTVDLARPLVDRVLEHPLIQNFDSARNIAIPAARFDWLWFLDADERIPDATGRLVNDLVRDRGHEFVALFIPFKSYFCGKWIEHCGWWPGYTMPRVLKRGHFQFSERLHSGVNYDGPEFRFPADPALAIDHFSYESIEHYVEKFNRYTSGEAQNQATDGVPLDWQTGVRQMLQDMWFYYEKNNGHLDGRHGWILSWLAGQYRWFSHEKLLDLLTDDGDGRNQTDAPPSIDAVLELMQQELQRLRIDSPQLPLDIVLRSPIWDPSGYADDGRALASSLAHGQRMFNLEPINWSDQLCHLPAQDAALYRALVRAKRPSFTAAITNCIPTLCQPDPNAALNILRTTFETDRIPNDWLPHVGGFDEVWVFSQQSKTAFRKGGVPPEKLRVVPQYVDTSRFSSKGKKYPLPDALKDRFVFLSIFDWQRRKGWDVLLRAYCQEFKPKSKAGLLLKISRSHGHSMNLIREQADMVLQQIGQTLERRPDIVMLDETLETDQLASLYRSADAFVLPTRGEGWGRPFMEAMATGLPTIGTNGSGNSAFMTDENSFLVKSELVDVPTEAANEIHVYSGHRWYEPDEKHLRRLMRTVFKDEEQRKKIAKKGLADIRKKYDVRQALPAIETALQAAESRFSDLQIPQLTNDQIKVQWEGELFAGHSFANINEQLLLEFIKDDSLAISIHRKQHNPTHDEKVPFAHKIKPYVERLLPGGPDVVVRHAFPPNWETPAQGKWIHIQPWEFGSLPLDWIAPLRDHVYEIWAPSNYVKDVYEQSGIDPEKIHVIPWGIDTSTFDPDVPGLILPFEDTFRFIFVGGTIQRKGFDVLLQAYCDEFSRDDPVSLVIKDLGTKTFYRYGNLRDHVINLIHAGDSPKMVYMDDELTCGQIASLYAACDCFVAPYQGEGFGMPILEAMACGLAPIVPKTGASDDFVSEDTGFLLPAETVECDHDWRLCGPAKRLSINVEDVRRTMRRAFEERKQTKEIGKAASQHVRTNFTWVNTVRLMTERITALASSGQETSEAAEVVPISTETPPIQPAPPTTVSLCLLTYNNERILGDCLGRIRPFIDELVVLDLGSSDQSVQLVQEYGARTYGHLWQGDFSLARNLLVAKATCYWVLWLNADEWVSDLESEKIKPLLDNVGSDVLGAYVKIQNGNAHQQNGFSDRQVRLFRNRNEILFSGKYGEHVESSISAVGGRVIDTDITFECAPERNWRGSLVSNVDARRLLHADIAASPRDSTTLFRLGMEHFEANDFFHAECFLSDAVQANSLPEHRLRIAWHRLVDCHLNTGAPLWAIQAADDALKLFPNDDHLSQVRGRLLASGVVS